MASEETPPPPAPVAPPSNLPATPSPTRAAPEVLPVELPILPVRNLVLFPGTLVPLSVQRPASLKLLEECLPQNKTIGIITQRTTTKDDPSPEDLYRVGTAGLVLKLVRQSPEAVLLLVQGLERFSVKEFIQTQPYLRARIEPLPTLPPDAGGKAWEAALRNLRESALKLIELTPEAPEEMPTILMNITDAGPLTDFIASNLNVDLAQRQALLEEARLSQRVRAVQQRVSGQIEIAQIQQKLQQDVSSQFTEIQRRAYLREQVKAIQRELGEEEEGVDAQIEMLRRRLEEAAPPNRSWPRPNANSNA